MYNGLPCMMNNYMLGHWQIKEQGIFTCIKLSSYYFEQFTSVHDISSNVLNQWIALKAHSDWLHKSTYPLVFNTKQHAQDLHLKML